MDTRILFVGTPCLRQPGTVLEDFQADARIDTRSDIYSLG